MFLELSYTGHPVALLPSCAESQLGVWATKSRHTDLPRQCWVQLPDSAERGEQGSPRQGLKW